MPPNSLKRGRSDIMPSTKDVNKETAPVRGRSLSSRSTTPKSQKATNESIILSPRDTPVAKRKSITNISPTPLTAKRRTTSASNDPDAQHTGNKGTDSTAKANSRSKIPTRLAIGQASIKRNQNKSGSIQSSNITTNSSLPLRKSNRSASQKSYKKK